jgi:toxin HigB-1
MIRSFGHKGLERLFLDGVTKGVQAKHLPKLFDILDLLDAAVDASDMNFPGSGLHRLKGKLKAHWSVKVSGNWRVTFRIENGVVYDVDYVDYH